MPLRDVTCCTESHNGTSGMLLEFFGETLSHSLGHGVEGVIDDSKTYDCQQETAQGSLHHVFDECFWGFLTELYAERTSLVADAAMTALVVAMPRWRPTSLIRSMPLQRRPSRCASSACQMARAPNVTATARSATRSKG